MNEITLTTQLLKDFFDLRKQYLETLLLFIKTMLQGQTTNIRKLSLIPNTSILHDSVYKKLLRFLAKAQLCQITVAKLIINILKIEKDKKHIVVIDRTYWMFGKTHLNFLYLSILVKGYAVPLFFVICGPNKKGHSSPAERMRLFGYFDEVFSYQNIEYVLADREFIGGDWMRYLQSKNVKFVQRCKDKKLYISNSRGKMVLASHLYHDLEYGEKIDLGLRKISKTNTFIAYVTILKTETGEIVVLAYSGGIHDPCEAYRLRWKIELCFRSLKTYGFNIEDLSIIESKRVSNLLLIVNIAFALSLKIGETIATFRPIKIKKHGRKEICVPTLGLQYIVIFLLRFQQVVFSIPSIIQFAKNLILRRVR